MVINVRWNKRQGYCEPIHKRVGCCSSSVACTLPQCACAFTNSTCNHERRFKMQFLDEYVLFYCSLTAAQAT